MLSQQLTLMLLHNLRLSAGLQLHVTANVTGLAARSG